MITQVIEQTIIFISPNFIYKVYIPSTCSLKYIRVYELIKENVFDHIRVQCFKNERVRIIVHIL